MATRINIIPNPRFIVGGSAWSANARMTASNDAVLTPAGVPTKKGVVNALGEANISQFTAAATITPGAVYSIQAKIYSSVAGRSLRVYIQWKTAASATITTVLGDNVTSVLNDWVQVTIPAVTAPALSDRVQIFLTNNGASGQTIGDEFHFGEPMVEQSGVVGTYFDGTYPNAVWTGTVNASTSVLTLSDTLTVFRLGSSRIGPLKVGQGA